MPKPSLNRILIVTFVFGSFFCLWEIFCRSYEGLQFILPAPSKVLAVLWEHGDRFLFHTFATFKEMMGGFAIALLIAFPLAWLMALFGPLRAIFQPVFVAIQCVPIFALAPLMVLWFGWSYIAIIIPTALMIFFPLAMSIYQGLCATPKHFLDFFQLHQATAWQTFYKLQLPWGLPHIFSGFRIAVALAGIGAVAGEWAGAQEGLGILMLESRRAADIEMMFGALACVTGLSLALYACAIFLEKKVGSRQNKQKSFSQVAVALLIVSATLCGCQQKKEGSQETTLILDWLPNPNHVAIYAGIDQGIFEANGIHLKILKVIDPSDSVPYLTSKQVDLCLTYMPHTIQALSHGAEIAPIGILIKQPLNALIFRDHEGIHRPEDLNGVTVGYCVDGYQTGFLQAMFNNRGIVPKEWHNVSFDLVSTLGTKQVDVLYGAYWNIEGENLRSWGIETDYFPLSDFGVPAYYELIFLAHRNSMHTSPEFVRNFQKALQESIDYAVAYPDQAFESYLKVNPDKGPKTRAWERRAWDKTIPTLATEQNLDVAVWNHFVEWLISKRLLKDNVENVRLSQ